MVIGNGSTSLVHEVAQVVVDSILLNPRLVSATAPFPGYAFEGRGGGLAFEGMRFAAVEHVLLVGGQPEVRLPVVQWIAVAVVYLLVMGSFKEDAVQVDLLPLDAGGDVPAF